MWCFSLSYAKLYLCESDADRRSGFDQSKISNYGH